MKPRSPTKLNRRRRVLFTIVLVCGLLALVEGFSYVAARTLTSYGLFYEGDASWQSYQEGMDPDLGWPNKNAFGGAIFDEIGARNLPASSDPHQPAIVTQFNLTQQRVPSPRAPFHSKLAYILPRSTLFTKNQ